VDSISEEILMFWFGTTDLSADMEKRQVWFRSTPEFDRHLIDQYSKVHDQAAAGDLDHLMATAEGCLTLIIALDQFPRNIHRGTAQAFATDPKARDVARHALTAGYDQSFSRWPRTFAYLPFEHSEDLADQERALDLYAQLDNEESMKSAIAHHEAINRFGRFPHRNAVLGRQNTPEEEEYLRDPPLWGKTAAEAEEADKKKAASDTGK
jgi:uncharacterized protein (DUF924 family)